MYKILVVDDCEDIRFLLSTLFSQMGYEVLVADCGERAIELLQEFSCDVVISDILMPKGDGIWLVKQMKSLNIGVPIFFITAGTDVSRSEALDLGVKELFRKPLNMTEVEKSLKRVLFEESVAI